MYSLLLLHAEFLLNISCALSQSHSQLHIHTKSGYGLLHLGLTLRLNGKKIIPDGGEVNITDLPVGGCRQEILRCGETRKTL